MNIRNKVVNFTKFLMFAFWILLAVEKLADLNLLGTVGQLDPLVLFGVPSLLFILISIALGVPILPHDDEHSNNEKDSTNELTTQKSLILHGKELILGLFLASTVLIINEASIEIVTFVILTTLYVSIIMTITSREVWHTRWKNVRLPIHAFVFSALTFFAWSDDFHLVLLGLLYPTTLFSARTMLDTW